jgi:hypothetical protein
LLFPQLPPPCKMTPAFSNASPISHPVKRKIRVHAATAARVALLRH